VTGLGVVPAVVIATSPSSPLTIRAGRARITAIGDTAAGVLGAVFTAAVLTAAPDAGDTVVASAVCAAIGASLGAVCTELAGCAGSELLTTGARDADEPVEALGEVPRPAATCTNWRAASRGIDGVVGTVVAAGVERRAVASVVGDTCCGAAEPDSVEVLADLVPADDAPVLVGDVSAVPPGVPVRVGVVPAPPELLIDDDGPPGWVP
jgi:hypothetical protein